MSEPRLMKEPALTRRDRIIHMLTITWGKLLGLESGKIDVAKHFLELGADSLLLLQASQSISSKFGVKMPFRMMLEEYNTINALADYIDQHLPVDESTPDSAPQPDSGGNGSSPYSLEQLDRRDESAPEPAQTQRADETIAAPGSALERILAQQLQIMAQQIEVLRQSQSGKTGLRRENSGVASRPQSVLPRGSVQSQAESPPHQKSSNGEIGSTPISFYEPIAVSAAKLDLEQQKHVNALIERVSKRTALSKQIAQDSRPFLADDRATSGFNLLWKEMQYPLVVERASGSRIWDVDGNEYVDLTMGFGALLFGHSPSFIEEAIHEQIKKGIQLGTESVLARKSAKLLCELTGVERVAFCNSGTEAVMIALRLARVVTGRTKVALFEGCYHGTFDGVLVRPDRSADDQYHPAPLASGVPQHMIENVILLKFADQESLEVVKAHSHELAAVVVEPKPSRMPGVRPREFLLELRRLTEQAGIALIFDEVVTGFRLHVGGAQALYGVKADLVTYGKAIGGGMPVAVVAGKAEYLNSIDGGMWSYGDSSYPQAETTFCVGTYFKHPFIMAAVWAVLNHLKDNSPNLHEELERTTMRLAETLNAYFEEERVPIRVAHFSSVFRFFFGRNIKYSDLFYYHLLDRGVYVCETRSCLLSTAHTERDIELVIGAVKGAVAEMRAAGLLTKPSPREATTLKQTNVDSGEPTTLEAVDQRGDSRGSLKVALTEAQKDLWLLTRMGAEASRAYNESIIRHISGPFDLPAMRKAVEGVIDRHEALRTTFSPEGDYQLIHTSLSIETPLADFSHVDDGAREAEVREWIKKEAYRVFDLEEGPLVRVGVARLGEQSHLLVLTIHHLVTDGWSNGILLGELSKLYMACSLGIPSQLAEPMQFSEYARLQATLQGGDEGVRDEIYWLDQLAGPAPALQLPADKPRPALRTYNGARETATFSVALHEELKTVAGQHGCTLFMLLLAGFSALMHRLSGQDDLVIGIPTAGQLLAGDKSLVGYCVNLLPFRSRIANNPTFAEHLRTVKSLMLDAYEHQNQPFGKLIKKLNLPRDPGRPTLVTVVFNLDKIDSKATASGPKIEVRANPSRSAKFDLSLEISETNSELEAEWTSNTDLFNARTIQRWVQAYTQLLHSVVRDPQQKIADIDFLSKEEKRHLLFEWNDTAAAYTEEECLPQMFEEQAKRTPERVATACEDEQVTYEELNSRANQLAHYLIRMGVGPEVLVGICVHRGLEMMVGLLGVLKAGGAYVPLDPNYPKRRLVTIIGDARLPLILTQETLLATLPEEMAQVLCLDSEWLEIAEESTENPEPRATTDNLAYVLYTSGSTGTPKGSLITRRGVINYLRWCNQAYAVAGGEGAPVHSPLTSDLSVTSLFSPLLAGRRVLLLAESYGVEALSAAMAGEGGFSLVKLTPAHMEMLNEQLNSAAARDACRLLIVGGEALSCEKLEFWRTHAPQTRLVNEYGPTETVVGCCVYEVREGDARAGMAPIGRPIINTQLYILDKRQHPVPVGVTGELYIGGEGVARGYLNQPRLTAEKFIPNPCRDDGGARVYRSGDLARYLEGGNIDFLGRIDDQVKIRGYRVEPAEVAGVLVTHVGVKEAVVIARGEKAGARRLMAYLVCEDEATRPTVSELRSYLKQQLPDYMIPATFNILHSLPLTPNGKVDRKALPEPGLDRPEIENDYAEPSTSAERLLTKIWAQALGIQKVGVNDNFFELGGDSMLGMQIITRANQAGLHLTPEQVFRYQTISELAAAAGTVQGVQADQGTVTGSVPLTPIYHWYFETMPEPHHFNQASMFEIPQRLDPAFLKKAVARLLEHHDMLRVRSVATGLGHQLAIADTDGDAPFSRVDLSSLPDPEQSAAVETKAAELQTSLNISNGPLIRVALFDSGAKKPSRLLIIIHHLAVDIFSWQILVEDLLTAYWQLFRGDAIELPLKTTSFKLWAERLTDYAQTPVLRQELSFWLEQQRHRVGSLPLDHWGGDNIEGSSSTVSMSLGADETQALLHELPKVSRTQIQEALMTALAQAFARWTGKRSFLADLEGHGRETIFEDSDLSRTVGWFTSLFPVMLNLDQASTVEEALKSVKEQLRSIPNGGIGYGLLRYMSGNAEVDEKMRGLEQAEVVFNYVGQLDRLIREGSPLKSARESSGPLRSPLTPRAYLIEVNVIVAGGFLQAEWRYSENLHNRSTIENLACWFQEALQSLIGRCVSPESVSYVPSDFALARLDEQKLSRLAKLLDKTEKPGTIKKRAINLSPEKLVRAELLDPDRSLPLVIEPVVEGLDPIAWAASNREFIQAHLLKHGGILFRNFDVNTAAEFGQFMRAVSDEVIQYRERSSPRHEVDDRVYTSTDYPASQSIFPHNEHSYSRVFPLKISFFCLRPADQGGETLIGDCRKVLRHISPDIRQRFVGKKWMYVRNFGDGFGLSWQQVFQTEDRATVERYCSQNMIEFEWKDGNRLRTRQVRPVVARHPATDETVWFNHATFFHVSTLNPTLREGLLAEFGEEDLPNNTFYGDGSPIEPVVLDNLRDAYLKEMIPIRWQKGDIVVLDNMLTAHARAPYAGTRKILVTMADPFTREDL